MSIQLHAQPYDLTAGGFYFTSQDEYQAKAKANRNDYGEAVEEYEIQFIDGDYTDCEFAKSWGIHQGNFTSFFQAAEEWEQHEKEAFIIAVGECGYDFDPVNVSPSDFDVDIYVVGSMRELAEQFIEEGLFGEIPQNIENYLDYDAIARDLAMDYTETTIGGVSLVYRCS